MATASKIRYSEPEDLTERIVIERREVVGVVYRDPNASENMVTAAFRTAGEYIAEHAADDVISVEFGYGSGRFIARYEPEGSQPS